MLAIAMLQPIYGYYLRFRLLINKAMNEQTHTALAKQLEEVLTREQTGSDASHDVFHARRVKQNAYAIAKLENKGNLRNLTAAAYLHDIVNVPKNSPDRDQASRLSATAAEPILKELDFSAPDIAAIQHCIEAHSFSANIQTETIDAKILQDADRLESLGALGIARTFYIAAKMESELFHGDDPFADDRELDDKRYAVDHFKVKLLTLADTMKTDAGKTIATQRTDSMRAFLDALADEIGAAQPW